MDNIDKKILEELQKNSSQPLSELSKKVGLSNTPCWNRIKKLDEEKIKIQLLELADVSEEKGIAIGIGHVKPQTLNVLAKEIPVLQEKGFRLEFVSNLVY